MSELAVQEEFMILCIVELHGREEVTVRPTRALLHFQVMSPRRATCQQDTEGEWWTDRETKDMAGCLHPASIPLYLSVLHCVWSLTVCGGCQRGQSLTAWTEIAFCVSSTCARLSAWHLFEITTSKRARKKPLTKAKRQLDLITQLCS